MGTKCDSIAGTLDSFTCKLPTNGDGSPKLPAGSGKVVIHSKLAGFADNSAASDEIISLSITSVTPNKSSPGGMIPVKIIGTGFPLSGNDEITLTICGNNVDSFISVENTELNFIVPK